VTPDIREACPSVAGRCFAKVCRTSKESAVTLA
jgi:hypothetical protein